MSEKNSLVEEAIIQMKNLEDVIAENAKGILASTMKGEISELVKESLKEQDEDDTEEVTVDDLETGDEEEIDVDTDVDAEDELDTDVDDEGMVDLDADSDMEFDDEEVVDMRGASPSELQKVFKKMKPEDGIIVTQEDGSITLSDENSDNEYLIKLGESKNKKKANLKEMKKSGHGEEFSSQDEVSEMEDMDFSMDDMGDMDNEEGMDFFGEDSMSMNEISDEDLDNFINDLQTNKSFKNSDEDEEEDYGTMRGRFFDKEDEEEEFDIEDEEEFEESDMGETIYEITLDDEMTDETSDYDFTESEMDEEWSEEMDEDYNEEDEMTNESVGFKPKGKGFGKPKFNYKKTTGGFKEDKKQGTRGVGIGKGPKFEFKENETKEKERTKEKEKTTEKERRRPAIPGRDKPGEENAPAKAKKGEHTEAARTLGNGRKWGRNGLNKPRTAPRHLATEAVNTEINMLKSKNEEYRKALNVFRDKLNEVAVFNSNLAYATRLFTEHTTTKQEKVNILKRFDSVETIKESKNLYHSIKNELTNTKSQPMNESIERTFNNTPSTGSAVNLIESKTYENPQFLRMKDLMAKLK